MDNTIDTLQIEIESSTTDAQRGLTKLKNSLQKLTEMSNAVANMNSDGISKLKEMAQGVESLANAGSNPGLSAAVSELRKLSKIDFSNLGAGSEKISEIADKVGEITNANPTSTITPPETSTETVPIAPSVDVEETKSKLSQLKDFAANIFSSIKTGATTVFGGVAKVIGGAFKGIVTVFQKLGSAAKSVFGAMKKLGSYIGGKLKGAVGGATKKFSGFIRSIGRVAMYRAIRFVLSQIATAFKEGTNNVYQYSKAIGGNLASSMDRIASSFLYLKNSFGAMVAPLINALAPAIEYVINKAVAIINVLNQLFAKLSGASTWTKAVKTQTEYAEAAGGAAEAAKSLVAGFDELNVLSDSGSGGGAGGMDYGSMFEEMQLDSDFAKWIDQIKEAIANGDWAGVGKILGDKVNELINKVDFAGIGDKLGYGIQSAFEVLYNFLDTINFDKIGAGIATTLNHMMKQIDFGLVGKTFAKKWTILVDTLYGFVTTFDWTKFGLTIADFINGWFEEIDLTKAVQTAQELILGIFESMSQAIRNVEWYKIGTQIMDAIESIDWMSLLRDLGTLLSDAVIGLLDLLLGVVGETDWGKVVQDICAGIGNMLANIEWGEILAKIGALVVELVVQLPGIIVGALGGIADILGGLFEGFGLDSVAGFFYGIGDAMRSAGTWLKKNLVDPVVNWVKDLFGIHSPSKVFSEIGGFLIEGLLEGISVAWEAIVGFFKGAWEEVTAIMSSTWDSVNNIVGGAVDTVGSTISAGWEGISHFTSDVWNGISGFFTGFWEDNTQITKNSASQIKEFTAETWSKILGDTENKFEEIRAAIKSNLSDTKTNTVSFADAVKNKFNELRNKASADFPVIEKNIKTAFSNAKSSVITNVNEMSEKTEGVFSRMRESISKMMNNIAEARNSAASMETMSVATTVISSGRKKMQVSTRAEGGFVNTGEMFIAREAGPELVGKIGNSTAVANNEQIVEAVSRGVYDAVSAAMANKSGDDSRPIVVIDGRQLMTTVRDEARREAMRTGVNPLLSF